MASEAAIVLLFQEIAVPGSPPLTKAEEGFLLHVKCFGNLSMWRGSWYSSWLDQITNECVLLKRSRHLSWQKCKVEWVTIRVRTFLV